MSARLPIELGGQSVYSHLINRGLGRLRDLLPLFGSTRAVNVWVRDELLHAATVGEGWELTHTTKRGKHGNECPTNLSDA